MKFDDWFASQQGSVRLDAVFFRLTGLTQTRLIPLEARIFVQPRLARVSDPFTIGNLLIGSFPHIGLAQVPNPLGFILVWDFWTGE